MILSGLPSSDEIFLREIMGMGFSLLAIKRSWEIPNGGFSGKYGKIIYTLWKFNVAIEHGPFIPDLLIKDGDFLWLC